MTALVATPGHRIGYDWRPRTGAHVTRTCLDHGPEDCPLAPPHPWAPTEVAPEAAPLDRTLLRGEFQQRLVAAVEPVLRAHRIPAGHHGVWSAISAAIAVVKPEVRRRLLRELADDMRAQGHTTYAGDARLRRDLEEMG